MTVKPRAGDFIVSFQMRVIRILMSLSFSFRSVIHYCFTVQKINSIPIDKPFFFIIANKHLHPSLIIV